MQGVAGTLTAPVPTYVTEPNLIDLGQTVCA